MFLPQIDCLWKTSITDQPTADKVAFLQSKRQKGKNQKKKTKNGKQGGRPSLLGCRPSPLGWMPLDAIAIRLEAITGSLEAIASRLDARLEAIALGLEAIALRESVVCCALPGLAKLVRGGLLNINEASVDELMSLPGIGRTARRALDCIYCKAEFFPQIARVFGFLTLSKYIEMVPVCGTSLWSLGAGAAAWRCPQTSFAIWGLRRLCWHNSKKFQRQKKAGKHQEI